MPQSRKKSKEERLFDSLLKVTQQFMRGRSYSPITFSELMEKLSLPKEHRPILKKVLKELVASGDATVSNNRYRAKRDHHNVLQGTIKVHPRGFGFVSTDQYTEDIFIPKPLTQNAVDGDKVEVVVNIESISEKGPEGKVVAIIERARTHLAGTICTIEPHGDTLAYVPMLGTSQRVVVENQSETTLQIGDRIIMAVIDWGAKETETHCLFSHHIGHINDPSCDIEAAIEEYELRADFPVAAVDEAKAYGKTVPKQAISEREDLRELECFTIDPDTAKDFDDAVSLSRDKKGRYHLGVHIADVTHYVKPNTALDAEARERANSTYFPGYCLPMIPKELSDNLCSLRPQVNRLTASVFVTIDKEGKTLDYRIVRSVIKSKQRMTYKEAKAILDDKKESPYKNTLKLMVELSHLLKEQRFSRGSLDLALPELVVMVDEKGMPDRTEYIEYDITHQLIEEFMLKANEIVASHLDKIGKNLAYRVHDQPAEENIKDFVNLARAFGFEIPDNPSQEELQTLFDEATGTPYGQHLATSYIRRMKMAYYSPDNIGHYGLSLTHYCHFTSPIRRYADLIVHRILFGESDDLEALNQITQHCSDQERVSQRAEQSVTLLKKLRLIHGIADHEPDREYEAVITSVKPFGLTVEVLAFMLEGFIHVSDLGDDYYEFNERKMQLLGRHHGKAFTSGDDVHVRLRSVDFIHLESKWDLLIEEPVKQRPKKRKSKQKPRRKEKKQRTGSKKKRKR